MQTPIWWRVKGSKIVDEQDAPVRLKGVCLGGWLNMENSITGYPGNETRQRQAVAEVLGQEKARFFFDRFLDYFLSEADLHYVASLGATAVRVAFNYRHFVRDERLSEYTADGLKRLDQLVGWARKHGLHVVLDLHTLPGWQSPGWHCDNPGRQALFWSYEAFEGMALAVWRDLATHFKDEPTVAGYNLMNEPVASKRELPWLHRFYRRATEAIREIDRHHIIFLDGNHYAQRCHELELPFDGNAVYSYHFYPEPVLETGSYPVELDDTLCGRDWLEGVLLERSAYMRSNGVPAWAGEFGAIFNGGATDSAGLAVLSDMLEIMNREGHHWTLWHYKDIGPMGVLNVDPRSEWMERTRGVRAFKTSLRCDYWIERGRTDVSQRIDALAAAVRREIKIEGEEWELLLENLYGSICQETLSQALLPAFAEQFRGMGEKEIDRMMQSFSFENCTPKRGLAEIVSAACN